MNRTRLWIGLAGAVALWPVTVVAQAPQEVPAPYPYPEPAWSPYVVGALIGVLAMLTLTISKKPIGASSAYADLAGLVGRLVSARHIGSLKYYQKHKPALNWSLVCRRRSACPVPAIASC